MAYLLGSPGAFAQTGTAPFVAWMQGLQQNSTYIVNQGVASEFAFNDCKMLYAPAFGTCFGNNPVTPYILANQPRSPSSDHLPHYMTAFDQPNHSPTSNTFYQLDTNEAIVTIIALPPQAAYYFGELYPNAPTFIVGVNHSASTEVTTTTPVNNATYTSISAADGTVNAGATDIAQIDTAAAGFTQMPLLSGSAAAVLSTFGLQGPNWTQFPHLNADIANLYIAVFERSPSIMGQCTTGTYCDPGQPFVKVVPSQPTSTGYIPSGDTVLLTERGYLLPSVNASPAPMPTAYFSGAAAAFLESPYVLYATPNSMTATPEMLKGLHH